MSPSVSTAANARRLDRPVRHPDVAFSFAMIDDSMSPRFLRDEVQYLIENDPVRPGDDVAVEFQNGDLDVFRLESESRGVMHGRLFGSPAATVAHRRVDVVAVYRVATGNDLALHDTPHRGRCEMRRARAGVSIANMVDFPHVLIDGGVVTGGDDPNLIGQRRYFVSMVDEEGYAVTMWDGVDRSEAHKAAVECAVRNGPVIDMTGRA